MSLFSSFEIAAMGLDTHVQRMQVHTSNIANINTPNYVRQIPVLAENSVMPFDNVLSQLKAKGGYVGANAFSPDGVHMLGTVADTTPGKKLYIPDHPEADTDGYVTMSNTNILGDMSDAMMSSRMYEANLSLVSIVKAMANRALEIGRG